MRHTTVGIVTLALGIFALASLQGQGEAGCIGCRTPRTCTAQVYVTPTGSDNIPSQSATATAIATAGLVRCSRVTMQCSITASALYWRVVTGSAGDTCAVAIYNSTGTTLIASSPESTTCATGSQIRSATGLTPFTLTEGTEYLACFASSGTTIAPQGNAATGNFGGTNNVTDGQNAAANKYQANADCTAASTPYACCTGADTGTCTGMPASLGTLAAPGSTTFAHIIVK